MYDLSSDCRCSYAPCRFPSSQDCIRPIGAKGYDVRAIEARKAKPECRRTSAGAALETLAACGGLFG